MYNMLGQAVEKLVQLPVDTFGTLFDLLTKLNSSKRIMWLRRLKRFLRGENPFGIPHFFEITTRGLDGEQCIANLEAQGDGINEYAKIIFGRNEFITTNGVTYRLALITGDEFEDSKRTYKDITTEAVKRGYLEPPIEVAPYIREMFCDEDFEQMGLRALIIMHRPIANSCSSLDLLCLIYKRFLGVFGGDPDSIWHRDLGFLFLAPMK